MWYVRSNINKYTTAGGTMIFSVQGVTLHTKLSIWKTWVDFGLTYSKIIYVVIAKDFMYGGEFMPETVYVGM